MTRAALRKRQNNLFGPGVAEHARPRQAPAVVNVAQDHPCQAPCCSAWGAFGFPGGAWFCRAHRDLGDAAGRRHREGGR